MQHLFLQLALALLQLRNPSRALSQHGLLLLQGHLQLQVLLTGALTDHIGTVKLLLQKGHLKNKKMPEKWACNRVWLLCICFLADWSFSLVCLKQHLVIFLLQLSLIVLLHVFHLLPVDVQLFSARWQTRLQFGYLMSKRRELVTDGGHVSLPVSAQDGWILAVLAVIGFRARASSIQLNIQEFWLILFIPLLQFIKLSTFISTFQSS